MIVFAVEVEFKEGCRMEKKVYGRTFSAKRDQTKFQSTLGTPLRGNLGLNIKIWKQTVCKVLRTYHLREVLFQPYFDLLSQL